MKFNRNELAGAFGDIGTDLPLLIAVILASGLYAPTVLIVFGLLQIITGFYYRMPMPVQPLKAMATLVISQKIGGDILLSAGLSIGIIMFILSSSGLLQKLWSYIPKALIRGLQLGLGLSLCSLAVKEYVLKLDLEAHIMGAIGFLLVLLLLNNKKYPAALILVLLGAFYGILFKWTELRFGDISSFQLPNLKFPSLNHITQGFLLLSLPQIPLSIGNSILATKQSCSDYFPERKDITISKLGFTYSFMNLISPILGGIPVCHGAGGIVGHYTFGGRSGTSVIIYGLLYVVLGLLFGTEFNSILILFPLPILGVILFFEGLSLILFVRDIGSDQTGFILAILCGLMAFLLPYGYVIALLSGILLHAFSKRLEIFK
ncbi:MAG: putative sulfate/molybdate transporter [Bacteroidia bacterium]|nr:putative sulfate/molybdate transporter [Bacteroidia bacterium]